ncbi:MAG: type IV pilus biogenesis/stability protein PilW [Sulfurifustis sp.]
MTPRFAVFALIVLTAGCASTAEREAEQAKREQLIETNIQLANGYLQRGQIEFARDKLERALSLDADDSQANNMMALLQWRLKDYDAAEHYFRRAVRNELNAEAQNNFGAFLCDRGQLEDAETWFKRAVANRLYKTPGVANQNAGLCFYNAKAYDKAEKYFRDALKLDPRLPVSLYHMGSISFATGRMLAARGFIQRYFQSAGPDTPEVLFLAVRVERALKNKDDEASYAVRLRGKFPTSPEAQELQNLSAGRKG